MQPSTQHTASDGHIERLGVWELSRSNWHGCQAPNMQLFAVKEKTPCADPGYTPTDTAHCPLLPVPRAYSPPTMSSTLFPNSPSLLYLHPRSLAG